MKMLTFFCVALPFILCTYYQVWLLKGGQMAEQLRNQAVNHKVAGSIPGKPNDVVSLGKALHPTCLRGECPCTNYKSLWIRASAKWLNVQCRKISNIHSVSIMRLLLCYCFEFMLNTKHNRDPTGLCPQWEVDVLYCMSMCLLSFDVGDCVSQTISQEVHFLLGLDRFVPIGPPAAPLRHSGQSHWGSQLGCCAY